MKKLRGILLWIILGLLGVVPGLRAQSGQDGQAGPVVSILFFENTTENPEIQWMSRSLADGLTASLRGGTLTLVERENLEDVIKEQKLSLSGLTDEDTALEVGRILNTSQLIRGGYVMQQRTLRVTAKITDTTTGEILFSTSVEGGSDRYFALEKELAGKLAAHYGFPLEEEEGHETRSLPALTQYYDGLLHLDAQAYEKAAEAFRSALSQDPAFLKPRESLEDSYRFLRDFRKARYQREMNVLYKRLDVLMRRAGAPSFVSYGDWVVQAMARGMSAQEISAYTQEHPEITWGNTRAEALWHVQNVMMEIAGYALEYFEDQAEEKRMYEQVLAASRKAQAEMPEDPFLPEIIYQELLAWRSLENWEQVFAVSERLMSRWPDFRMMWAVEGFYEESLEKGEWLP